MVVIVVEYETLFTIDMQNGNLVFVFAHFRNFRIEFLPNVSRFEFDELFFGVMGLLLLDDIKNKRTSDQCSIR